jgi:hypothetical protein
MSPLIWIQPAHKGGLFFRLEFSGTSDLQSHPEKQSRRILGDGCRAAPRFASGSRDADASLRRGGACFADYWTKAPIVKYGEVALVRSR